MPTAEPDAHLEERRMQFATLPFFQAEGGLEHIRQLSGGQQNQNYLVSTGAEQRYVVRVPGVDAAEHGQTADIVYANTLAAHKGDVAPCPCFFDVASGLIVTEFVDGETLTVTALRERPELLANAIATIRRAHKDIKAFIPSKASDFLFGYDLKMMEGWRSEDEIEAARHLQSLLKQLLDSLDELACCHQDLTPANFITDSSGRMFILDWEWAGPGDPLCDLATFCALSEQDEDGQKAVIAAYLGEVAAETSVLTYARVQLWRIWFALRGALWARQKTQSCYFGAPTGPDDDYKSFAEQDMSTFSELVASEDTKIHMDTLMQSFKSATMQ